MDGLEHTELVIGEAVADDEFQFIYRAKYRI
jgi:hypothetical protein